MKNLIEGRRPMRALRVLRMLYAGGHEYTDELKIGHVIGDYTGLSSRGTWYIPLARLVAIGYAVRDDSGAYARWRITKAGLDYLAEVDS